MMKNKIILLLASMALLTGCLKDNTCHTTYVLQPKVQLNSVDEAQPLQSGVQCFTYAVDTTAWGVACYEDALAGVITSKKNPSEQRSTPDAVGTPFEYTTAPDPETGETQLIEGWLQMPVGTYPQMIVAVDTEHRLFGYTEQVGVANVPQLYVQVIFQPWKEAKSYKGGAWSFYNDFYEASPELQTFVSAKLQAEENGALTDPQSENQIKVFAFAADTTVWKVASYEDALSTTITRKDDPQQQHTSPDFKAYRNAENLYEMTVTASPLMVVVVDRTNRLYAYSQQQPDLRGEAPTWDVVFRAWQKEWISVENGWRVVNDALRPNQDAEPKE